MTSKKQTTHIWEEAMEKFKAQFCYITEKFIRHLSIEFSVNVFFSRDRAAGQNSMENGWKYWK